MQSFDGALQDRLRTGQIVSRANSDLRAGAGPAGVPAAGRRAGGAVPDLAGNHGRAVPAAEPGRGGHGAVGGPGDAADPAAAVPGGWAAQQTAADVADIVEENITGVRVVKGFGQEDRETGRLREAPAPCSPRRSGSPGITAGLGPLFPLITTLGQVGVLGFGGLLAMNGQVTLGTFVAFNGYVAQIVGPTRIDRGAADDGPTGPVRRRAGLRRDRLPLDGDRP